MIFFCYLYLPIRNRSLVLPLNLLLLFLTTSSGTYLIHLINKASYGDVMRMAPVLGTLWVWGIVRLDLNLALASLATTTGLVWWLGLKIGGWSAMTPKNSPFTRY
jgi:hypothetical protein